MQKNLVFLDLSLQTQMETTEAETTQERYLSTGLKYVLDQVRTQMEIRLMYRATMIKLSVHIWQAVGSQHQDTKIRLENNYDK